jgi:hypothetical protein
MCERAFERLVSLNPHLVGHVLQVMIWSSYQTAIINANMRARDSSDVLLSISVEGDDKRDRAIEEMASEFSKATFAGAHRVAMDLWQAWVKGLDLNEKDDFISYCQGVDTLAVGALQIATGQLKASESLSEMLGANVYVMTNDLADGEE